MQSERWLLKVALADLRPNDHYSLFGAENTHARMPFPMLSKCHSEPTYQEMTVMHNELYQNILAITSPYGDGQAGFLGILMPNNLNFQLFNKHVQPPKAGKLLVGHPSQCHYHTTK